MKKRSNGVVESWSVGPKITASLQSSRTPILQPQMRFIAFKLSAMLLALCFVGALLFALYSVADGQQQARVPKIGWLGSRSASAPAREVFARELRELGYIEGKNIAFEY